MKMDKKPLKLACAMLVVLSFLLPSVSLVADLGGAVPPAQIPPGTIDPTTIPKFVNQINGPPPVWVPTAGIDPVTGLACDNYTIGLEEFQQQILPTPLPTTLTWGYSGIAKDGVTGTQLGYVYNSPAPSFEAVRDRTVNVKWVNNLSASTTYMFPIDPTLHWANPTGLPTDQIRASALNGVYPLYPPGYNGVNTVPGNPSGWNAQQPIPIVTHLHGGEDRSTSDGYPEAWWTNTGLRGPEYYSEEATDNNAAIFRYPNEQEPTTLWYHDHALGVTRINVMSGLAGFYLLRDPADTIGPVLPSGKYEVPLVFQDRTFNLDGTFWFDQVGLNPTIHPYWMPEFFGNTIMVNGMVWPNMNVDQGQYRLRLLDGSNARFYTISFWDRGNNQRIPFQQIGSDGGYLRSATWLTSLTIAPGERADILIDFSALAPGTKIIMKNTAKAPFPNGAAANPQTVGQLMQFTVTGNAGRPAATLPTVLNSGLAVFPSLSTPSKTRILVLVEIMGAGGPTMLLLNGQEWMASVSENPQVGATEEWVIVNPTADTHPIHLHLVQFQLVTRQKIDAKGYFNDWVVQNGGDPAMMMPFMTTPTELAVDAYLKGKPVAAPANEQGWKDTIQMNPGEITVIRVRWAQQDGTPYSFDSTFGPGYVWHCHILEHEDNEMMRPYTVMPAAA